MSPTEERYGLVLDFDGTITDEDEKPLVQRIDYSVLKPRGRRELEGVREKYQERALRGRLSPDEERDWLEATFRVYAREKLTLDRIYEGVDGVKLREGAVGIIGAAVEAELPVAIVSFGLRQAIRRVLAKNGLPLDRLTVCAAELSADHVTRAVVGYHPASFVLPHNKGDWSRRCARRWGVALRNLLAVGDTPGDRHLGYAKRNRLGLARNEDYRQRLLPYCGTVVITPSFRPVADFVHARTGLKL